MNVPLRNAGHDSSANLRIPDARERDLSQHGDIDHATRSITMTRLRRAHRSGDEERGGEEGGEEIDTVERAEGIQKRRGFARTV